MQALKNEFSNLMAKVDGMQEGIRESIGETIHTAIMHSFSLQNMQHHTQQHNLQFGHNPITSQMNTHTKNTENVDRHRLLMVSADPSTISISHPQPITANDQPSQLTPTIPMYPDTYPTIATEYFAQHAEIEPAPPIFSENLLPTANVPWGPNAHAHLNKDIFRVFFGNQNGFPPGHLPWISFSALMFHSLHSLNPTCNGMEHCTMKQKHSAVDNVSRHWKQDTRPSTGLHHRFNSICQKQAKHTNNGN
jgi:hypothetical protein